MQKVASATQLATYLFAHVVSASVTSGDHSLGMMNKSLVAARRAAVDDPAVPHEWAPTVPCKPSFMVIGAPKCGSTSLFQYLEAHPQVHHPTQKELCFFSEFKRRMLHHQPGLPQTSWPLYQAAFAGKSRGAPVANEPGFWNWAWGGRELSDAAVECSKQQAFEGCPFYLGEVRAAGLIYRAFPQLRVVAVLRNPRERTVSAFNDYVRMGRIHAHEATRGGLEKLIGHTVALVASGNRSLEDFDVRILTSGVYIHGLRSWGEVWPTRQLLVLRSEDMFADAVGVMKRVQDFLQLPRAIPSSRVLRVANRNSHSVKAKPSRNVNATLDAFFAPYNAQLYAWMEVQGRQFKPWD